MRRVFIELLESCLLQKYNTLRGAEICFRKNFFKREKRIFLAVCCNSKGKASFCPICGFLAIMSLCGIISLSVQLILYYYNLVQYSFNIASIIALIVGLFVFNLLFAGLCIYLKIIISAQFNRWLYDRNILSTLKIL